MAIGPDVDLPTRLSRNARKQLDVTNSLAQSMRLVARHAEEIKQNPHAASQLLQASRELTTALQRPDEVLESVAFSGSRYACVRVAIEMDLFDALAAASKPLTVSALAKQCHDADPQLVLRITRALVGMGFAADARTADGSRAFAATAVTRQMTLPSAKAGMIFHFDQSMPVVANAGSFFRENGFRVPKGKEGLFQYSYYTDKDFYSYWLPDDIVMDNFNASMQGCFGGPQLICPIDWFPFDKVCFDGFDDSMSEYVWVDIGGGKGRHAQELVDRYPHAPGKFIVQDLPHAIGDNENRLSSCIEKMPHDAFEPQPIRSARVYCLEDVLQHWSDDMGREILTQVRDAMTPGYSKLLVSGVVVADSKVPLMQSGLDASMLMIFSGSQRSKQQWSDLLASAGLSIRKIWGPPKDGNSIIEAERRE